MLLRIQLLNPTSSSHRRGLQCSPSHWFCGSFRQCTSVLCIQLFWLPHPTSSPPDCSFWPSPCHLFQARQWAELFAAQKLLNKIISRNPIDWAPIPFAEPTPFILNLLQIREESRNLKKAPKTEDPRRWLCPRRWLWCWRSHLCRGGWEHRCSNSNIGS